MPRLSDSMEGGTILRWLVADGDDVMHGQELAKIETDKATMTYEADAAGVFRAVAAEGDTLPVGELIATIGETAPTPPAGGNGREASGDGREASGADGSAGRREDSDGAPPSNGDGDGGRVKVSPVAREHGVDLRARRARGRDRTWACSASRSPPPSSIPPQPAILAVGALEPKPGVHEGVVDIRHRVALTVVCDHRIVYGADAARFLARLRELLEEPLRLAL